MWAKILNVILGLWIMIAPGVLGFGEAAADNGHIIGPVIVTFSVVALWEATHSVVKWNYPLAIWLLLAPWVLGYGMTVAILSDMAGGALILLFTSVKKDKKNRYGGGWSSLWSKDPAHARDR